MVRKLKYTTTNFIGETSRGVPGSVFWDPHTPIANGRPPVALVTGAPGGGKTFFCQNTMAQAALMGKTVVGIDRKGDLLALKNLENEIGDVRIWALGGGGTAGSLDPFYMTSDPAEKLRLAFTVIDIFVGGLKSEDSRALSPIIEDVIKDRNTIPSLTRVVDALRGSPNNPIARDLGAELNFIRKMNHAKVCFSPGKKRPPIVTADGGITIATLLGLDLPPNAEAAKNKREGRLASGIFYLLTDFIQRMLKEQNNPRPKMLVIDEAWAILATDAGKDIVKEVSLLGRSKKLALMLATQNYTHLNGADIDNTITSRFAFRAEAGEAENVIHGIGLDPDEGFQELVTSLDTGECLMRDWQNSFSSVQISDWRKDWATSFNNNPFEVS